MSVNETFIEIIKKGLNKEKFVANDVNWVEIYKLSVRQAISGFIYEIVKENEMDGRLRSIWKNSYISSIQKSLIYNTEFKNICDNCNQKQVRIISYKGSIIKKLYPNPDLRIMGDLDFCYDKSNVKTIDSVMKNLGYSLEKNFGYHRSFKKKPYIEIEFHQKLHEESFDIQVIDDPFKDARLIDGYNFIYELSPTNHFMFLITHIYQHFLAGGAGIRNYIDLFLFYNRYYNEIDFAYIENKLEKINLKKFYLITLDFMNKCFKNQYELQIIEEDIFSEYLRRIFSGGIYGSFDKVEREEQSLKVKKETKFKYVLHRLFPSYGEMISLFPCLKIKILIIFLPLFYFWRIMVFLFTSKNVEARVKFVFKKQAKDDEFIHKIGL